MNNKFENAINQALNENPDIRLMLDRMRGRSPRYRYITRQGSKDRYFWTVEKINRKGKQRYIAGIYRHLKSKNQMKLVKQAGFAKRYAAVAAATGYRDSEAKQKATPPEVAT